MTAFSAFWKSLKHDSRAEDKSVERDYRERDYPQNRFLFGAGREVIDILFSRLYHVSHKHIAPEEADHTENIDYRADDQKVADIFLSDRSSQFYQREYDSVEKIREQIYSGSDSVSFFFVVVFFVVVFFSSFSFAILSPLKLFPIIT